MLIDRCNIQAGHKVLIWGAAGGLGVFATQLTKLAGADSCGVVSSDEKGKLVKQLGARGYINRNEYEGMMRKGGESPDEEKARFKEMRRFGGAVREILGDDPDIVFEHVGQATFPTSVFVVKRFGKVVICGATSGYNLDFDVRYLWMRQKEIIGSHFANAYQANEANKLMAAGKIRPVLWRDHAVRGRRRGAPDDAREQAPRKDRDPRRRRRRGSRQDRGGPGRDSRRGRKLTAAGARHRDRRFAAGRSSAVMEAIRSTSTQRPCGRKEIPRAYRPAISRVLAYGAKGYLFYRSEEDPDHFIHISCWEDRERLRPLLVLA